MQSGEASLPIWPKQIMLIAIMLGAVGVGLGAIGAHALESALPNWYPDPAVAAKRAEQWEIGVRYHMYHVPAVFIIGLLGVLMPRKGLLIAAVILLLGMLGFSGSLYLLVFTGAKILGLTTAIGGVITIVGWLVLFVAVMRLDVRLIWSRK
jgi:uncharacterized membrane protein YgdD (TMEM256/DUF423 family)